MIKQKKSVIERIRVMITLLEKELYTKEEVLNILKDLIDE